MARKGNARRASNGRSVPASNWQKMKATGGAGAKSVHTTTRQPDRKRRRGRDSSQAATAPKARRTSDNARHGRAGKHGAKPVSAAPQVTKYLGLDCEMVGVGPEGTESVLAQVCVVNEDGAIIYAKYVAPQEAVIDYRTHVSGILPHHLVGAPTFAEVQKDVAALLKGRILVGHAVFNDLKVLMLDHPRTMTRDTAFFPPFCKPPRRPGGRLRARKLKDLAKEWLGLDIQTGEHSPAEDARVTLRLFKLLRVQWEQYLRNPKKLRAKVMQLRPHRAVMAPAARPVNGAPSDATGSGGGVPSSAVAGAVGSDRGGPISGAVPSVLALLRRHPRFCDEVGATAAAAAAAAATSGGATADHALTPAQRRRLRTVGTLANSGSGSGSGGQPAGDVGALPWKVLARAETAMEFMSSDTDSDEGDARGDGHSRGNSGGDSDASGDYDSDADWGL